MPIKYIHLGQDKYRAVAIPKRQGNPISQEDKDLAKNYNDFPGFYENAWEEVDRMIIDSLTLYARSVKPLEVPMLRLSERADGTQMKTLEIFNMKSLFTSPIKPQEPPWLRPFLVGALGWDLAEAYEVELEEKFPVSPSVWSMGYTDPGPSILLITKPPNLWTRMIYASPILPGNVLLATNCFLQENADGTATFIRWDRPIPVQKPVYGKPLLTELYKLWSLARKYWDIKPKPKPPPPEASELIEIEPIGREGRLHFDASLMLKTFYQEYLGIPHRPKQVEFNQEVQNWEYVDDASMEKKAKGN